MKHGQERHEQPLILPRQEDPTSDSGRSTAQSFKDRVTEYNHILTTEGPDAAHVYATEALYVSRNEQRGARW